MGDVRLSDGKTAELVRAAKAGDPRAREQLIERFMPLVVSQARHFRVEGLEFADLVQEGVVGLPRALLARGSSDRRGERQ